MELYTIDPLSDRRWDELVARHSRASAFHQRGWLDALSNTYGYKPYVLTSAPPGKPLTDGVVVCQVSSWITGTRTVSLPFADHCEPLINDLRDLAKFTNWLHGRCDRQHWKYFELRPLTHPDASSGLQPSRSYWLHSLDLGPSLAQIYGTLHRNSIQRKIRRAEKERLTYEVGGSKHLLSEFYRLMLITRTASRGSSPTAVLVRKPDEQYGRQRLHQACRERGCTDRGFVHFAASNIRDLQVWLLRRTVSQSRGDAVSLLATN